MAISTVIFGRVSGTFKELRESPKTAYTPLLNTGQDGGLVMIIGKWET